jgi:hypothetical protein
VDREAGEGDALRGDDGGSLSTIDVPEAVFLGLVWVAALVRVGVAVARRDATGADCGLAIAFALLGPFLVLGQIGRLRSHLGVHRRLPR